MKTTMFVITVLTSFVLLLCFGQGKGREVRQSGILIRDRGTVRSMELTAGDMLALVYGEDEIPGFACVPNPYNGLHTLVELNIGGDSGKVRVYNRIVRAWYLGGDLESPIIRIECVVGEEPRMAQGWLRMIVSPYSSGFPMFRRGSYSGLPLGDECWRNPPFNTLFFTVGRVGVIVQFLGPSEEDGYFAEALAWGVECRIREHPKQLAEQPIMSVLVGTQPVAKGRAVSLAGVAVAPISSLSPAKVTLQTKREKGEWAVTASLNERWVKVKAFSWEMETDKGKVKLERPIFPYKGELVVPLRQVAEALGIRVEQKGQTIALLPRE